LFWRYAIERTKESQAPFTSLPWAPNEMERSLQILGGNFWSYGVDANRPALEALCRYSHTQGIITRSVAVDELFAPMTLSWTPSRRYKINQSLLSLSTETQEFMTIQSAGQLIG
jgi:hypothetical protein